MLRILLAVFCLSFSWAQNGATGPCVQKCMTDLQEKTANSDDLLFGFDDSTTVEEARKKIDDYCESQVKLSSCIEDCPLGSLLKNYAPINSNQAVKYMCIDKKDDVKTYMINCEIRHNKEFNDKCSAKLRVMKHQLQKLQEILQSMVANPQAIEMEETLRRLGKMCWSITQASTCVTEVANEKCEEKERNVISQMFKASVRGINLGDIGSVSPECQQMAETAQQIG